MKLKRLEEQLEKVKYDYSLGEERELRVLDIETEIDTVKSQFNFIRFLSGFTAGKGGRTHAKPGTYAIIAAVCLFLSFIIPFFSLLSLASVIVMFAILFYDEFYYMNMYKESANRTMERKREKIVENKERKRKAAEQAAADERKRKEEEQKRIAEAARLAALTPEERVLDDLRKSADENIELLTEYKSVARNDLIPTADKTINDVRENLRNFERKFIAAKNSETDMKQVLDEIRRYTRVCKDQIPEINNTIRHARNRKEAENMKEILKQTYG